MSTSPTLLTRFYGIELHYAPANGDDPPYLRAVYGDETALFDLYTCEIVSGALPRRAEAMVREWFYAQQYTLMNLDPDAPLPALPPLI